MCGLAGLAALAPLAEPKDAEQQLAAMTAALTHRGPDAEGFFADAEAGVLMGHRRLSIQDISAAGAQPMTSACGRYVIVFNGEIYNHLSLRQILEAGSGTGDGGSSWRGGSDTETFLAAVSAWGLKQALRRSYGMFALAIWDRQTRQLSLARDRMGEKPLYLTRITIGDTRVWAFASELHAFRALPGFQRQLDPDAIQAFLTYSYVPDDLCIYQGVAKIRPGEIWTLTAANQDPIVEPFQVFDELLDEGLGRRNEAGNLDDLEALLLQVVDEQMLSDVPLGCFLSGGIDSSLVASLMQAQRDQQVRTFSVGFDVPDVNEAPHAAAIAQHLKTDHTEFILREDDALAEVPHLASVYDEPFADPSQIPTTLLSRLARQSVTVALTGDGGDEVFGGYNRHILGPGLFRRINAIPRALRPVIAWGLEAMAPLTTPQDSWLRRMRARLRLPVTALDKAVALAPALRGISTVEDLYHHFAQTFHDASDVLKNRHESTRSSEKAGMPKSLSAAEWMMAMDSVSYLPGDILTKVDRAAMASSLETRTPYLDGRVIAAAWALPEDQKISGGKGKQPLRYLLSRHIPAELFERPKQGFAIPLDVWLRGALREWALSLMDQPELSAYVGLDIEAIKRIWDAHQCGAANRGRELWSILMLLRWVQDTQNAR